MRFVFNTARRVLRPGQGAQFWLGQISLVVSTVLGVYLAAHTGFEKALQFDALTAKRNLYFLLTTLEQEVTDNMKSTYKIMYDLEHLQVDARDYIRDKQMDTFVWQAMKESGDTFRVPASVLNGIRNYYNEVEGLRTRMTSSAIGKKYYFTRLKEENYKMKKEVLPVMKRYRETLRQELVQKGLDIGEYTPVSAEAAAKPAADNQGDKKPAPAQAQPGRVGG